MANTSSLVLEIHVDGLTSLTLADRNQNQSSVCRRIANVTEVLQQPAFVQRINELTVNTKSTNKAIRKLSSAENKNPSAKTIGGGMGAILVGINLGFIVLLDVPWKRCCPKCT